MRSSFKRFVFGSDNHSDNGDPKAIAAFFSFVKDFQPHIRIHGGDNFEFRPLRKKASAEEQRESMVEDLRLGYEFLATYRPHYYLLGNHCARIYHLCERAEGPLLDYALQTVADLELFIRKIKCTSFPYDKRLGVLQLGGLRFIHGFSEGQAAPRNHAMAYGDCIYGHTHARQQFTVAGWPEPRTAVSAGCLCKLDLSYNSTHIGSLGNAHGWSYGILNESTGDFKVFTASKIGDKWIVPKDF